MYSYLQLATYVHTHTQLHKSFYDYNFVIVRINGNVKLHIIVLQFHVKTKRKTALLKLQNVAFFDVYRIFIPIYKAWDLLKALKQQQLIHTHTLLHAYAVHIHCSLTKHS